MLTIANANINLYDAILNFKALLFLLGEVGKYNTCFKKSSGKGTITD